MILHPVQLVSLQTDQGRKIHEDPMDLEDLLLHPHHIIVSEEGKGATTNSLSLKKLFKCKFFSILTQQKCFQCKISWPHIAV